MDPTKDQTDQPKVVPNNQDVASPVVPSVGGPAKEVEPSLINASEKGPEIAPELTEIGVKEVPETPQLIQEHTKVEIRVSDRPVKPVTAIAAVSFELPLTQAEMVAAKKSRISDAIAWLAATILRQVKRSRFNQKQTSPKPI